MNDLSREDVARLNAYNSGPVWDAFGLTYAAYAVFPRRALQSMPVEWQVRFITLVNEMHEALPEGTFDADYTVTLRVNGRIAKDPMREYRHAGPLPLREPYEPGPVGKMLRKLWAEPTHLTPERGGEG